MLRLLRWKRFKDALVVIGMVIAALALVAAPAESVAGARSGLELCLNVILPSLFPFFVLSALVVDLGLAAGLGRVLERFMRPLFRVSGSCAAAVVLGFVGGYPVGARTAIQLYEQGQCSRVEAERLLAFCNNSGPAFILGVVGAGIFGDSRIGLLLYLTHALASLLVGLLFRFHRGPEGRGTAPPPRPPIRVVSLPKAFTDAVTGAMRSTLSISAFVIFFSVVLRLLTHYGVLDLLAGGLSLVGFRPEWARRLVAGLLELTSGVSSLTEPGSLTGRASMAAFMLGWAGISVHCQVLSFLIDSGLSARTYLTGKLCHGLLAAGLTWLMTRFLPLTEPVSAYLTRQTEALAELEFATALRASLPAAGAVFLLLLGLSLPKLRKKGGKSPRNPVY